MPEPARRLVLVAGATPRASTILPLTAEGLVLQVGGARLVDGVDLVLAAGGPTVIMGPNGAGKSLLLRLLHGLIPPTAGRVLWQGRPADHAVRLRQAMVFQKPVLLRRSVAANIDYALKVHRLPRNVRRERLARALRLARLEALRDRPARVLSGGEQQRLALARALATRPEILFLDEPTASLDPASTLAVEELIGQAVADGTKIVLVTHDPGQARRLADEVVFLHRGRVTEQTAAERFFVQPASAAARDYLAGRIVI